MERPLSCHDRGCGFDSRRNCQICKRLYAASQLHSPAKRLVMVRVHALPPTMGVWCKGSTVRNQAESGKYKLRLSCQPQPASLQGQELTVTSNKLGAHVLMVAREVCTFPVVSSTLTVSTNLWDYSLIAIESCKSLAALKRSGVQTRLYLAMNRRVPPIS